MKAQLMRSSSYTRLLLMNSGLLPLSVVGTGVSCLPIAAPAQTLSELRAVHKAAHDPHAVELLKQMTDAYTHLTYFDQQTEYYSLQTPVQGTGEEKEKRRKGEEETQSGRPPTGKDTIHNPQSATSPSSLELPHVPVEKPMGHVVRLIVAGNRLRLDTTDAGDADTPAKTSTTLSDGKTLWVYNPTKNWYTQTKAPRTLRDFQKVANLGSSTLELMMMMGLTPFADVDEQFDAVKYEGTANTRGVQTDVVLLRTVSEKQIQELRFYIDVDDSLLRRLVIETKPIAQEPTAPPKHNILDDLIARPPAPPPTDTLEQPEVAPGFEDPYPLAPPGTPMYIRITSDNTFTLSPQLEPETFIFKPPAGAALYQDVNGRGDYNKMSAPKSVQELIKQQMKAQGRTTKATKKSKPVKVKL